MPPHEEHEHHHHHRERVHFDLHPAQARQLLTGLSMVATQIGEQGPSSYQALLADLTRQARERYAHLRLDG